ncbi:metal ABC transporter ATP-binding protein [uncultured Demequina sp.]|uniref:metal ABC transporter ATP-binding protein n=1 Tax=uncultured Demequina sp. TaxID=693499 RepID=UPI0025D88B3E|nr:metal ABC transporter ATP-binding protein [uncultured Demequina sp.]
MNAAVEARGLALGYGSRTAVAPSDFTIPTAAITAIIGPNGSGKSTLMHAIAGALTPLSGELTVLGESPTAAQRRLAYVFQSVDVPTGTPLTVRETVGMGRYATLGMWRRRRAVDRDRVAAAMAELEVTDLAARHLTELSGGQRQRVFVAQGIAQDHELLMLDEPLTGLDLNSARTIDRILHADRDKAGAVVLSTHDLDEAFSADHVLLMNGRVLASGPPQRVLTRENLETAYGLGALHEHRDAFLDDTDGAAGASH